MTASLTARTSEPEVVKPGLGELPKLPEVSETSAIDVGDWLHSLTMGDLSNSSSTWWQAISSSLEKYYMAYLGASTRDRLNLRPEVYALAEVGDNRWARVDKRAASMILASLPESVKNEILAARLVGTLQILARAVVLYRPGGAAERQQILRALESPTAATNPTEAVDVLRRWSRWLRRAGDVGLQPPDPSILLKGLDSLVKKPLGDSMEISFRVNMLRYTLEVDMKPTQAAVVELHQALLSEFEQVAFKGRTRGGAASLKEQGCKKGASCQFSHEVDKKQRQGRCFTCGSKMHIQKECPTRARSLPKAPAPSLQKTNVGESTSSTTTSATATTMSAEPQSGVLSSNLGGTSSTPSAPSEASTEVQALLKEANMMLRQMTQMNMKALRLAAVEKEAEIRTGLLDSGASHPYRLGTEEELESAVEVQVQLADGKEVVLRQASSGTLLTKDENASPIVPLGDLVSSLNCSLEWNEEGMTIQHPERGEIRPRMVENCPVINEKEALELIRDLEEKKGKLMAATRMSAKTLWMWDKELEWSQHLLEFLTTGSRVAQLRAIESEGSPFRNLSSAIKATLAEEISLDANTGAKYFKAMPVSRRLRRTLLATPWTLHLFAGDGGHRELHTMGQVLEVDLRISKAFNLRKPAGTYRALLWAASQGLLDGIVGAPPCRGPEDEELVAKQLWLSLVAKAARIMRGGFPVYVAMEGGKLLGEVEKGKDGFMRNLSEIFASYKEAICLETITPGILSNLHVQMAENEPRTKRPEDVQRVKWMMKMDNNPQTFLKTLSTKELAMWKAHIRNNHLPYNRRCRTCVESSGLGRMHRKIKTPSSYCLSLDILGPLRQLGEDPDQRDYRYMLVGAYLFPRESGITRRTTERRPGSRGGWSRARRR